MSGTGFDREQVDNFYKGEASSEEAARIETLFNEGCNVRELKKLLSEQFNNLPVEDDEFSREKLDKILHTLNFEINEELSGKRSFFSSKFFKWTSRIAGLLILPLLLFAGLQTYRQLFVVKDTWVEIKAPAWTRVQFALPDGTTGWLNSNSSVKYRGDFIRDRQVDLTGEAFFNVVKNEGKPFIVHTSDIYLKVLGTRFNVASYCDERNIEIVLEEGSLVFMDVDMKYKRIMSPDDLLIYDKNLKSVTSELVQPKKYLSWTEGTLVFRNDPIDVVARRLGRWFNSDVVLENNIDTNLRLRATFVGEGLEEVLELLKYSLPVDYRIENATIRSDSIYTRKKIILLPGLKTKI